MPDDLPDHVTDRIEQRTVRTLLAFHRTSGIRQGLRAVAPLTVLLLALPVYLGPDFIESISRHVFPTLGRSADRQMWTQVANPWAIGVSLLLLSVIAPATRPLRGDFLGTLRSLPFSEAERRRALHLGSIAVAGPLGLWCLFTMIARILLDDGRPAALLLGVAGLTVEAVALGGFGASVGVRRRVLWGLAAVFALQASVLGIVTALLLLGAASGSSSSEALPRLRHPALRPQVVEPHTWTFRATLLPVIWNLRVLPWSRLASAYLSAALVTLPILFFLMNNELPAWIVTRAIVFGATAASLALVQAVYRSFETDRPPLRWERSLPWSSQDRVVGDLLTLTILLAPILLLIAAVRPTALPPVIAIQLVLGSRWIVHQRTTTRSLIGSPAQQLMAEGALAVLLATVAPLLAIGMMIVAIWPLSGRAIRAERRLRVSSWQETPVLPGRN